MKERINHTFFYPHSPEVVWDYLTKANLMEQWLMKNDFLPIVGHDFRFTTSPMPHLNFDGIIYCKVLEIIPLKKLSYSWKSGPENGKIEIDSLVVLILTPKDDGTELILDHSGFKHVDVTMFTLMDNGWLKNIQKINELMNKTKSRQIINVIKNK